MIQYRGRDVSGRILVVVVALRTGRREVPRRQTGLLLQHGHKSLNPITTGYLDVTWLEGVDQGGKLGALTGAEHMLSIMGRVN